MTIVHSDDWDALWRLDEMLVVRGSILLGLGVMTLGLLRLLQEGVLTDIGVDTLVFQFSFTTAVLSLFLTTVPQVLASVGIVLAGVGLFGRALNPDVATPDQLARRVARRKRFFELGWWSIGLAIAGLVVGTGVPALFSLVEWARVLFY